MGPILLVVLLSCLSLVAASVFPSSLSCAASLEVVRRATTGCSVPRSGINLQGRLVVDLETAPPSTRRSGRPCCGARGTVIQWVNAHVSSGSKWPLGGGGVMGIELSREEIDRYLNAAPRGILCVTRDGHAPLALPMWFAWVDGKVVMHTSLKSKKVAAVRRHPEVSFLVESGEHYWTLKAALIIGSCQGIDDQTGAPTWMARIEQVKPLYKEQLFPKELPSHLQRFYAQDRAALVITPKSMTSWDFAKVRR